MGPPSTFQQVGDISQAINEAHLQVSEFFNQTEWSDGDGHCQLLVMRLRDDQRRLHRALERYLTDQRFADVLQVWIQYIPENEIGRSVLQIERLQSPTLEELVEAMGRFYRGLNALIQRVREQTESEQAKKLLDDLALHEEQIAKALTKSVLGARDE